MWEILTSFAIDNKKPISFDNKEIEGQLKVIILPIDNNSEIHKALLKAQIPITEKVNSIARQHIGNQ